jgi:acetylornithine deacetylase/succinyl-diaminopimelate desuccinylase-like protein
MPIDDHDVEELLSALIRIESVTPWLIPDGTGEKDVVRFMRGWLEGSGADVTVEEVEPGRPNLLARLRGTGDGPTLCLNAHADTVGFDNWRDRALEPRREGDRLIGLGAADDKAGCAIALLVLRQIATSGVPLRGDLLVACVADEEGVSIGTMDLVDRHRDEIDAAIILEPDALPRCVVEHQGFGWIDVVVHGKAAHGSTPDEGVDAIVHMAEVITRLAKLDREVFVPNPDAMNGRTVFHTGTIVGGTDYATYPSRCTLGIEIGTQPGERLADRVREIEAVFAEVRESYPDFRGQVAVKLEREPFRAEGHEALWKALDVGARQVLGRSLEAVGLNAWADSALIQSAGIPTLMAGPLGGNFHAPQEWVSIGETVQVARIVEHAVRSFCG